jgi:hypothetical protein
MATGGDRTDRHHARGNETGWGKAKLINVKQVPLETNTNTMEDDVQGMEGVLGVYIEENGL